MRSLDALAPAPAANAFDPAKLIVKMTRTFARFARQPFEEQRDLLRAAFREIVVEDGAIPSLTLNGGFWISTNLESQSVWPVTL